MGAALNYQFHGKVIWAYTIMQFVILLIAYICSSEVLKRRVYIDLILTVAYFVETIIYLIIMSQFVMLQAAIKTRFTALNKLFW